MFWLVEGGWVWGWVWTGHRGCVDYPNLWPGLALGVDDQATSLWVYGFLLYAISDTEGNGSAMLPGSTSPKARCMATGWHVDILVVLLCGGWAGYLGGRGGWRLDSLVTWPWGLTDASLVGCTRPF